MGLSGPNVLKPEMVKEMAENPLVLALANPNPEILPELAREARPLVHLQPPESAPERWMPPERPAEGY